MTNKEIKKSDIIREEKKDDYDIIENDSGTKLRLISYSIDYIILLLEKDNEKLIEWKENYDKEKTPARIYQQINALIKHNEMLIWYMKKVKEKSDKEENE